MYSEEQIKMLISAYIDGEISDDERETIEDLLCNDAKWQKYFQEVQSISSNLTSWNDENLSPDLETKLKTELRHTKQEEPKMEPKRKFPNIRLTSTLIIGIVALIFGQQYVKKEFHDNGILQSQIKSDEKTGTVMPPQQPPTTPASIIPQPAQPISHPPQERLKSEMAGSSKIMARTMNMALSYDTAYYQESAPPESISDSLHMPYPPMIDPDFNTEEYAYLKENDFRNVQNDPLSTFSIDVDTASYSNVRRFLNSNQLPQTDAVRIEEMINYFDYQYPEPSHNDPFSITALLTKCPWNDQHKLAMIGLKGKSLKSETLPPSNLVFLIDVSGSMNQQNKLPLLKQAFKMMVQNLSDQERVAIVVYAGAAGKVLDSTPGSNKYAIIQALDQLQAGGSTAGGAGIQLAYQIAKENFIKDGNNRVILATDGDFNIGVSSTSEMTRLIEEKRKEGIFLTVLGFGMGNYKDNRMESLADKGNGNYYYIDTQREAQKVLVNELGSTLFTIAKDVKIQIEFNPNKVKGYKLIGYENRVMANQDFNDDTKDAGELGAGHTVTALYEIIPADSAETIANVDPLKYQTTQIVNNTDEWMIVKLRYKNPDSETSQLLSQAITDAQYTETPNGDFQFAAAVAEFGLILRNSQYKGTSNYAHVISAASASKGEDKFGYRQEFIDLVKTAQSLDFRTPNTLTGEGGMQFK